MARSRSRSRKTMWGSLISIVAALMAALPPMASESIRNRLFEYLGWKSPSATAPLASLPAASPVDNGSDCVLLGCKVRLETGPVIRVLTVPPGSTAARLGLVPNDWIESVNRQRVKTLEDLNVRLSRVSTLIHSEISVFRGQAKYVGELRMNPNNTLGVRKDLEPIGARDFF